MSDDPHHWQIIPQGFFSRHFDLFRGGEHVAALQMAFWTEGCEFSLAGHEFRIERVSLWKDGFRLLAGDRSVCEVHRGFWTRRFELLVATADGHDGWLLQPAGWFTRDYQLHFGEREVGRIRPVGWFTRRRIGNFTYDVPLPIQVLAIFLVLIVSQRQQRKHAPGGA